MVLLLALSSRVSADGLVGNDGDLDWPELNAQSRPWAFWWWMGSAVSEGEITELMESYSRAGLGGVHVIPIYGAKGREDDYIEFLSDEWTGVFGHAVSEADRLGMGVDMSTGTGWPFGGPQVEPEHSAKTHKVRRGLTGYSVKVKATGQKVKRAAPGGEGLVMDYFSRDALADYLKPFDVALGNPDAARPRAFYNDSYEAYGADWTDDFFDEFEKRRGYDLRDHLGALAGKGDEDEGARVLCDYRETVADLLLEEFTEPWVEWVHSMGGISRNQAHGSPGNLLDLYAAVDVPETEAFGPSLFEIPGLDYYKTLPGHRGKPDPLAMKFASSSAHVAGRRLVSSESCTWLGEHFAVSLAHAKPEIDLLMIAGINHVFYHGVTYSPPDAEWPGWLFYASTNFAPSNSFWRDLPALNAYIARTQAFLQAGRPDNDILLYWPVHDLYSGVYEQEPGEIFTDNAKGALSALGKGEVDEFSKLALRAVVGAYEAGRSRVTLFSVHDAEHWLSNTPFGEAATLMWERGYAFDYVSDRMLARSVAKGGKIVAEGGADYRVVVVPACRYMPEATMESLARLADGGAKIVFIGGTPGDVPGLVDLEARRDRIMTAARAARETGNVIVGDDLDEMLDSVGVRRERAADLGISFIRKRHDDGHHYLLTSLGASEIDGWFRIGVSAKSAALFDAMTGASGVAATRRAADGGSEVYLQLKPGQSIMLRTFADSEIEGPSWKYFEVAGAALDVSGEWEVEFIEGGPQLPPVLRVSDLQSWTEFGEVYKYFSGTARYSIALEFPATGSGEWILELGEVRDSARVMVNGAEAGVVFSHPFEIRIGEYLKPGVNRLEIEVTNLSLNRIIDLDRRRVKWKHFHDINFVDVDYIPFNAANWPLLPSGLIGPVRLAPRRVKEF